jgi:hypothetical protein
VPLEVVAELMGTTEGILTSRMRSRVTCAGRESTQVRIYNNPHQSTTISHALHGTAHASTMKSSPPPPLTLQVIQLSEEETRNNVHAVIKHVYGEAFRWLVRKINSCHGSMAAQQTSVASFIGILGAWWGLLCPG